MKRIPAIVCDIDGVLIRGDKAISGSQAILKRILNNLFSFKDVKMEPFKIPFVCLTNGGGYLEE